jgi:prepilin-type N-terminal cleavage/methylation domain-containing protein
VSGNSKFLSLFEESLIVAIRPPKSNSQGFTLIEMIVTVMVGGILMTIAIPSFLSWNKPLRDGSLQFKSQLSLIRSKAISSGKAYRIRPKFLTPDEYLDGTVRNFVVEYADNCKMLENDATPAKLRWQMASQFDMDLPPNIGIPPNYTGLPSVLVVPANPLDWNSNGTQNGKGICFDNRGIVDDITTKIILKDSRGDSKAKLAILEITKVGGIDINTYDSNNTLVPANSQGNPEF